MLGRLSRNLALLYSAELFGKVIGLVVFGFLGRVLLETRYGDLEFALGLSFVFNLVVDAGLTNYAAREAARTPSRTDALVGQIFLLRVLLVAVAVTALAGIGLVLPRDPLATTLIFLQGVILLPTPLVLTWVFQARDQMHVVAAASVIRQVGLAVGVWWLVREPADVWFVPIWDGIGLALAVGLQVVLFRRSGGVIAPLRWTSGMRKVIVDSAPFAGSSIVWAIRLFAPLLILGVVGTSAEVGFFGAGHRLVIAAHSFVWLYFFNLLPSFSRLAMERPLRSLVVLFESSLGLVGWVVIFGAAVGSLLAPAIIPLVYGAALAPASEGFAVMVWMLAVAFVSGHHRFALLALSQQRGEFAASAVGSLVSVVGCLALWNSLTPLSAACVLVLAEFVTFVAAGLLLKRVEPRLSLVAGVTLPLLLVAMVLLVTWFSPRVDAVVAAVALVVLAVPGGLWMQWGRLGRIRQQISDVPIAASGPTREVAQ